MSEVLKIDETFKLDFKGQVYDLLYAPFDLMKDHDDRVEKSKDEDIVGEMKATVEKIGLPKDISGQLPPRAIRQILSKSFGLEKK